MVAFEFRTQQRLQPDDPWTSSMTQAHSPPSLSQALEAWLKQR